MTYLQSIRGGYTMHSHAAKYPDCAPLTDYASRLNFLIRMILVDDLYLIDSQTIRTFPSFSVPNSFSGDDDASCWVQRSSIYYSLRVLPGRFDHSRVIQSLFLESAILRMTHHSE